MVILLSYQFYQKKSNGDKSPHMQKINFHKFDNYSIYIRLYKIGGNMTEEKKCPQCNETMEPLRGCAPGMVAYVCPECFEKIPAAPESKSK
jgi:hypothetical protein